MARAVAKVAGMAEVGMAAEAGVAAVDRTLQGVRAAAVVVVMVVPVVSAAGMVAEVV